MCTPFEKTYLLNCGHFGVFPYAMASKTLGKRAELTFISHTPTKVVVGEFVGWLFRGGERWDWELGLVFQKCIQRISRLTGGRVQPTSTRRRGDGAAPWWHRRHALRLSSFPCHLTLKIWTNPTNSRKSLHPPFRNSHLALPFVRFIRPILNNPIVCLTQMNNAWEI